MSDLPNHHQLLSRAASWGPGYLGQTSAASAADRDALAKELADAGLEPPAYLANPVEWTYRDAKLFEAGDYPDKGLTVTANQMAQWVESFDLPVPIWIEHGKHPFEFGYLTAIRVEGNDLKGTVALTPEANALVDKSKAHRLSIGLTPELDAIREVSVVRNPRVPGARLFSKNTVAVPGCAWNEDVHERLRQYEARETVRKVDALVAEGRIVPAQRAAALVLMTCQDSVTFDNAQVPVAQLVESLLKNAKPHSLFTETVPGIAGTGVGMEPDHEQYFRKNFPGLNLEEIAKRLRPTR
jgi:hypothetical protein